MIELTVLLVGAVPLLIGLYAMHFLRGNDDEGSNDPPPPPVVPPPPFVPSAPRKRMRTAPPRPTRDPVSRARVRPPARAPQRRRA